MVTKIFKSGNSLALRLPRELQSEVGEVSIERVGDRLIVEPIKSGTWPKGFFASIQIDDPDYQRQPQGSHREIEL